MDQSPKLLVLRHAESTFITDFMKLKDQFVQNETLMLPAEREIYYHEFVLQPQYVDTLLSDTGLRQCEQVVLPQNLHPIVYVSPLRRTIQTACHVLQNHPLKQNLILKLTPELKETMSYQNTLLVSGDCLRQFCEQMEVDYQLRIDTSFLDQIPNKQYWFFHNLQDKGKSKRLLEIVAPFPEQAPFCFEAQQALKTAFMEVMPGSNETQIELFQRSLLFKRQVERTAVHPVLCVTHSGMIQALKSSKVLEDGTLEMQGCHVGLASLHEL